MAQLVASASGVVLGGVAEVVGSNLARGKIFTASIGYVDSLYPSVYIYIICVLYDDLHKLDSADDFVIIVIFPGNVNFLVRPYLNNIFHFLFFVSICRRPQH